jgi:protease-4
MASEADLLIDRRRIRRKLTFWRVAALVIAAIGLVVAGYRSYGDFTGGKSADHIAKIRIDGTIMEDEDLVKRLDEVAESNAVKGVLLSIDSPGGTTAGGEMIFDAIRRVAAKKPIVAQIGTVAASGGYLVACGADYIIARQTSIVGSIGVLVQFPDLTGLMDKLGIKLESIKSSPLKAEPNPFNPTTDEERAVIRNMILDSYNWFVDLVAKSRKMDRAKALELANGAVFTGRQSKELGLVDSLGGEREAVAWLEDQGLPAGLKVIEWKRTPTESGFLSYFGLAKQIGGYLGLSAGDTSLLAAAGADRMLLDGLLSVWHPDQNFK